MRKVYVQVDARFTADGKIIPHRIVWEDGKVYTIDEVLDIRRAASLKAGGIGMRYLVRLDRKEAFLWYEEPAWFMEGK